MKKSFIGASFFSAPRKINLTVILAMRLTFLLILVACLQASAGVWAQSITYSNKDVSLEKVFEEIQSQTGYEFLYNTTLLKKTRNLNIQLDHTPLKTALSSIFKNLPIEYSIVGTTIILREGGNMDRVKDMINTTLKEPTTAKIRGTVVDSISGSPLVGVTIQVKGSAIGTTTNTHGEFSLEVPNNAVLEVSYIGYTKKEIPVNGKTIINISLATSATGLSQLVVIGYGTQTKRLLTGSVSTVNANQLDKVPATTVDQALQGRAAGVQITNDDASPGASISIKIRGTGTFGNNAPLYVVDGFPVPGNDLSALNPNDIASISILKDASATAIYGDRASNGVVLITTKRGKADQFQISLNAYTSIETKPKEYKLMNAQQFVSMAQLVNKDYGYPILPEWEQGSTTPLGNINWQNLFYQTGVTQNYNLALRGGSDKIRTSFSLGYDNRKGNVIFSNFKRYSADLNLDYTPNKWLKAAASINYSHWDRVVRFGSGVDGLSQLVQLIPTMTGNPVTNQPEDSKGNFGYYTQGVQATQDVQNDYANVVQQDQDNPAQHLLADGYIQITPIKGLSIKSNFGVHIENTSSYYFTPSNDRTVPNPLAYYSRSATNSDNWLWENTISFKRTFGINSIDFVGGVSAQKETDAQVGANGNGLISNSLRDIGSLQLGLVAFGNQESWALESQFGRLTYTLLDKYIVTGTLRRDGSSRFGPGHQWGVFPSVGGAWIVKDEPFLSKVSAITNLKIRGSWGEAGNQNIALFQYLGTYGSGTSQNTNLGYNFGPGNDKVFSQGLALLNLPDPTLTWETSSQSDIGLDASFLDGRLSFTADVYQRLSSNFLLEIPVPAQTGFSSGAKNVGSIRNRGLELSLDYNNSRHPFQWDVSGNVTFINNRIMSFTNGLSSIGNFTTLNFRNYGGNVWAIYSQSEVGGTVGAFYGYKTDGIFQTQDEIDKLNQAASKIYGSGTYYQSSQTAPGDRKFVDLNHDGRITEADRTIIGSPIPKFFGGLSFNASYKQWDFSAYFYGTYGNKILNYMQRNLQNFDMEDGVGIGNMSLNYFLNHWTPENHSNIYPRITSFDANGNNAVSDVFVDNGSYLRLKNIQVGYTLPSSILKRISINKIRVYVSAQNLLTITNYPGLDPEVGDANPGDVTSNGVDVGNYPTSQHYTLGLNVTF